MGFENISPNRDDKIGGLAFRGIHVRAAASGTGAGLDVPCVNLRCNGLTASTGAPVVVDIVRNGLKRMDMLVSGTQFITAFGTQLCFPIQSILVRGVGGHFSGSCTGGANTPVTIFVGLVDILVGNFNLALISATIAELVTIRSVGMVFCIGIHAAAGACFPVLIFIKD